MAKNDSPLKQSKLSFFTIERHTRYFLYRHRGSPGASIRGKSIRLRKTAYRKLQKEKTLTRQSRKRLSSLAGDTVSSFGKTKEEMGSHFVPLSKGKQRSQFAFSAAAFSSAAFFAAAARSAAAFWAALNFSFSSGVGIGSMAFFGQALAHILQFTHLS